MNLGVPSPSLGLLTTAPHWLAEAGEFYPKQNSVTLANTVETALSLLWIILYNILSKGDYTANIATALKDESIATMTKTFKWSEVYRRLWRIRQLGVLR